MRVFVISNPVAGKRFKQGLRLPDWITSDAQQVMHRETEHQGHGESLAKEACQQGFDTIIAAGGDGTIPEI